MGRVIAESLIYQAKSRNRTDGRVDRQGAASREEIRRPRSRRRHLLRGPAWRNLRLLGPKRSWQDDDSRDSGMPPPVDLRRGHRPRRKRIGRLRRRENKEKDRRPPPGLQRAATANRSREPGTLRGDVRQSSECEGINRGLRAARKSQG